MHKTKGIKYFDLFFLMWCCKPLLFQASSHQLIIFHLLWLKHAYLTNRFCELDVIRGLHPALPHAVTRPHPWLHPQPGQAADRGAAAVHEATDGGGGGFRRPLRFGKDQSFPKVSPAVFICISIFLSSFTLIVPYATEQVAQCRPCSKLDFLWCVCEVFCEIAHAKGLYILIYSQ